MIPDILTGFVGSILAALFVFLAAFFLRRFWLRRIRQWLILSLSNRSIVNVFSYEMAVDRMSHILEKADSSTMDLSVMKVLCFMGRDLTFPEDRLAASIRGFLSQGGNAYFLIMDPKSKHVRARAAKLDMDPADLERQIRTSVSNLQYSFRKSYPTQVTTALYDHMPVFRLYFIQDILFLGFYHDISSYHNDFFEVPNSSALYRTFRAYFDWIKESCQEVSYGES